MQLDIISYQDLLDPSQLHAHQHLENALLQKGIVGIRDVPDFEKKTRAYIQAARDFSALPDSAKLRYAPARDSGEVEGYELGAEWFKNQNGEWQIDDKKASFYAHIPQLPANKWPQEIDLETSYIALGELIFATGKLLLNVMGLNETVGLQHAGLRGFGRMLHYHKQGDATNDNPDWCGAHFDHSVFTGLVPAYYFRNGEEINEPEEAGLYIKPTNGETFEKIHATDKSILLFQVGEFGQLLSNDRIRATKHIVKKAHGEIERFTYALFHNAALETIITSSSILNQDARYQEYQSNDGSITYAKWHEASFARYRAK